MPKFIEIGGSLKDKCFAQIPDSIWDKLAPLTQKQITEAVEKGLIADTAGGIGIKKSPRYHISIKSDYRLCTQLKAGWTSEEKKSSEIKPFVSPFSGRTAATAGEQRAWFRQEEEAKKQFLLSDSKVILKFLLFDREKDHATLKDA